jgi:hypothetical protein
VRLRLRFTVPLEGSQAVTATFVSGLQGSGRPVLAVLTIEGASLDPILGECVFTVTAE